MLRAVLANVVTWGALAGAAALGAAPPRYPPTRRVNQVDRLHGIKVEDPYRWLEADLRTSPEVADWVAGQNKFTHAFLKAVPEREAIKRRLTELWNYEKITSPHKVADRFYVFSRNDGLQNQDVVYTAATPDAAPQVLLDPNTWTKDGTAALAGLEFSGDGKYLAYGVAESGSDWVSWKVLEVETRRPLADDLKWTKFTGVSWAADSKGLFYSRYPGPKAGEKYQAVPRHQKAYYHRLGTPQADDVLVYERPDRPDWLLNVRVTGDGRYLVIRLAEGGISRNARFVYRDLREPGGKFVGLIDRAEAIWYFIDNEGPVFYFQTDLDAPRGRVIAVDSRKPARTGWRTVVPQGDATLLLVNRIGDRLICNYFKDAHTQLKVFSPEGKFVRELPLPGVGTAGGVSGRRSDTDFYYTYLSFATPPTVFRHDLVTGKTALWRRPKVKFDPGDYEVKQVFYASKDGTKVPLFISHKKGLKLDGGNPTLLHGYGGFNRSLAPDFDPAWLAWMEQGGVFALANIRGGGEYGREWHRAAIKQNRQRAYDDFIAAAEYLVAAKYTRPAKLAIHGSSNGGLLVSTCMVQRPDLFGACLPDVGTMDMLRFHKFGVGPYTVSDHGSPDDPDEFKALRAISPYHNLKKGVRYPATLVTTADTDDRAVPMHSFKFVAQLQHCQAGDAPVLLRVETGAGHGAPGRPTSKQIEEATDRWAFLVRALGIKWAPVRQ
ncbi:MAG TPA: prolyl oligopeptidase family serine peptidase [Gemmataceae bacterium]|jgi:prolyl oligopeptidase|nr:prolyl oligopeptidase family serine peptidase [Gemmataceae bacterium]